MFVIRVGDHDHTTSDAHEQEFDIDELIIHEAYIGPSEGGRHVTPAKWKQLLLLLLFF